MSTFYLEEICGYSILRLCAHAYISSSAPDRGPRHTLCVQPVQTPPIDSHK